jgi:hypothetical protein
MTAGIVATMWLDRHGIRQRLERGDAAGVAEALEAIHLRWEGGETLDLPPFTATQLAPLAARAEYAQADRMVRLLLGVKGLSVPAGFAPIAELVAHQFPIEVMHAVAMALKVCDEPVAAVTGVMTTLGLVALTAPEDRRPPIEHFVSCLLDGSPDVRAATTRALGTWPRGVEPESVR